MRESTVRDQGSQVREGRIFCFLDFELDEARRELRRRGRPVPLQPTTFRLLLYLVEQRPRAVPRRELLDQVWPNVRVSDATLSAAVRRLRQALREAGASRTVVENLHSYGYRLCVHGWQRRAPGAVSPSPQSLQEEANRMAGLRDPSAELFQCYELLAEEAIWCFALDPPPSLDAPLDEFVEHVFEDAKLVYCNQRLADTYGYADASELIGWPVKNFLLPEAPENIAYVRSAIRANFRVQRGLSREVDREGRTRWIRNNAAGIVARRRLHRIWGTQRDVTELRRDSSSDALARALRELRGNVDRVLRLLDGPSSWEGALGTREES